MAYFALCLKRFFSLLLLKIFVVFGAQLTLLVKQVGFSFLDQVQ